MQEEQLKQSMRKKREKKQKKMNKPRKPTEPLPPLTYTPNSQKRSTIPMVQQNATSIGHQMVAPA